MAWRGSLSRSVMATARASTIRTSAGTSRLRPPPLATPRLQPRRPPSFANSREEWKRWVMRCTFSDQRRSSDATLYLRGDHWIN